MKILLIIALACCFEILAHADPPKKPERKVVPTYELYNWQGAHGPWNFCLLHTTDRQKTPAEVLNDETALRGPKQLKRKMSKLPRSSTIVWFDRLTLGGVKLKGSESLKYPPDEIVGEIRRYADMWAIKLFGPGE